MILTVILMSTLAFLAANGETTLPNCPSGVNYNYQSTAYQNKWSPITYLNGQTFNSGGFYSGNSAEECCYNCFYKTDGKCTTWTYDGCGVCYLSSATGSSNYLVWANQNNKCQAPYVSGFILKTQTTSHFNCVQKAVDTFYNTPSDSFFITSITDNPSACCDKCGNTSGCVAINYEYGTGKCWLKFVDLTYFSSQAVYYSGMLTALLTTPISG